VTHHAGDLGEMTEVVRYPGGKQLAQRHSAELRVAAPPIQVITRQSQRLQAVEAGRPGLGKNVQELGQGLAT
jgi:hypothetical protein